MRIVAGRYGGRKLKTPKGRTTRPTSERVREALFSMLGNISGAIVLDLFAGSGALGIEALSRGAERAVFIERDKAAIEALSLNLAALSIDEAHAQLRRGDALAALREARQRGETYDLIFVDPPYARAHELGRGLSALLPGLLRAGARVIVESDRRVPLELELQVGASRRYGDTTITIHTHVTEDEDER